MEIDSAVKTEQELGNFYIYSELFQITAAPTPTWFLDASVYIFSLVAIWIKRKYSCL